MAEINASIDVDKRLYAQDIKASQAHAAMLAKQGVTARCEVTLDAEIVRVAPTPRRAFQGWRYLDAKDAPQDLAQDAFGDVPTELALQLREAGAW